MSDIVKHNNLPTFASCPLCLEVSPKVELKHVRQIEGSFSHKLAANPSPKTVTIDNSTKVEVDKENLHLFVYATFTLAAKQEKEQDPAVKITASFLLAYELTDLEGLTDQHFSQFAEMNGVFNAWPYWREYVQSATVRMGLPALTIPVFTPYKPKKTENTAGNEDTQKQQAAQPE